jgi:hypothetical protein
MLRTFRCATQLEMHNFRLAINNNQEIDASQDSATPVDGFHFALHRYSQSQKNQHIISDLEVDQKLAHVWHVTA